MDVKIKDRDSLLADLLKEEIDLRNHVERVAELRRKLPPGPVIQDYVFREGPAELSGKSVSDYRHVRLSELFEPGKNELLVYHYMYAPGRAPCPMCTMWIDGFNAVSPHVTQHANFAVVAKQEIGKLREWARGRNWNNLRLLSSHDSTFNRDLGAEDPSDADSKFGGQIPGVSVFTKDSDGSVRHFYTKHAELDDDIVRGIDLYTPVWNLFDLLPSGRDDWYPELSYKN